MAGRRTVGRRRFLLAAGALLAAPRIGRARAKVRRLGVLSPGPKPVSPYPMYELFVRRLRELGWIEGETLRIDHVYSGDRLDRLPELARMLVAKEADAIWTGSPLGAVAAARATTSIPIVFWRVGFPVELGLVDSLARPGRNVTGLAWVADESIYVKRYQLLREIAPNAARVGTILSPGTMYDVSGQAVDLHLLFDKVAAARHRLAMQGQRFAVRRLADFDSAFAAIERWGADGLLVTDVPVTILARERIIGFARRHRLVDVYETREWAEAGGLASYGIVLTPTVLRSAEMVDRILRGAKPAEIPVELPSKYELVINRASAMAQGFEVPRSILLRADQVIG